MTGASWQGAAVIQRLVFPLILAASLIAVMAYYIPASSQLQRLMRGSDGNLIGMARPSSGGGNALSDIGALAANPLNQQAVNGVIAAGMRATNDRARALRETAILRELGWRNTNALQNLLWRGGTTGDLPLVMDTFDALLRRERLLGEIYPILNLMTTDPAFRDLLTRRLLADPPWRRYYFQSASDLTTPAEIEGRYLVMSRVQAGGDRLLRNEVAPILPKLISIGQAQDALRLWSAHIGGATSPLTDLNFAVAATPLPGDALPISFEWQLGSGSGYSVDADRDQQGSFVRIDWNGRGAPSFISQNTTAQSGRYRFQVTGDAATGAVSDWLGLRFTCPSGDVAEFAPVSTRNPGQGVRFTWEASVGCDNPRLELYGRPQAGTTASSIIFRTVRLERVGA